jgi:hypothetical protein
MSPEKPSIGSEDKGQMSLMNHDSTASTESSTAANGEKFVELKYKWGIGFIQVPKFLIPY